MVRLARFSAFLAELLEDVSAFLPRILIFRFSDWIVDRKLLFLRQLTALLETVGNCIFESATIVFVKLKTEFELPQR